MVTVNCQNCQKEFEAERKSARFCSTNCRVIWNNKPENKERIDKEREEINSAPDNINYPLDKTEAIQQTKMVVEKAGLKVVPSDERWDKVRKGIEEFNKIYGPGTVQLLGDKPLPQKEVIPTGSFGIDLALGVGGFPRGRIIEIYGSESSGKTTIALKTIAQAQKMGLKCALIDVEQSFDPEYANNLGVKINELVLTQSDYGEQALEWADKAILSGEYGVIVVDSVAALIPKAELEGEHGDSKMGLQARLMSQACRKLVGSVNKTNTLLIFINQLRAVIGNMWGPSEITTGGNALKFYASVRLEVKIGALIKDGEDTVGRRIKVKVVKSKVAPPYKTAEFDIMFGEGISREGEIIDKALELNIMQKSGSWFNYNGKNIGQGREAVKELLSNHPLMMEEIETKIKELING